MISGAIFNIGATIAFLIGLQNVIDYVLAVSPHESSMNVCLKNCFKLSTDMKFNKNLPGISLVIV